MLNKLIGFLRINSETHHSAICYQSDWFQLFLLKISSFNVVDSVFSCAICFFYSGRKIGNIAISTHLQMAQKNKRAQ